jgi:putative hydrolase of the HAD superfamily
VQTWIFDLDNTLYPSSAGLVDQMNSRIRQYLRNTYGVDEPGAVRMQAQLSGEHGTTLRGLMVTRGVDPAELLAFEHDIDYAGLKPDPLLAKALIDLPGRKFVMTNSVRAHADIVLERLGFDGIFDGIFDLLAAQLVPKPHPQTYHRMIEHFGIDPLRATMVDDLQHNLEVPRQMGMRTIWAETGGAALAEVLRAVGRSRERGLPLVRSIGGPAGLDVGDVFDRPAGQGQRGRDEAFPGRRQLILDPRRDLRMHRTGHQTVPLEAAQGECQHALGDPRYLPVQIGEAQQALVEGGDYQ